MYAGKYQIKGERDFNDAEKAAVSSVEVVSSEFGKSCCFFMTNGLRGYIPLDKESQLCTPIGTVLDINNLSLRVLSRPGDSDIQRVVIK